MFDSVFDNTKLAGLALSNRFAVAPMTRVSADPDGVANALMVKHYQRYVEGGFGLVITEGVYPDDSASQGYANQPGIADVPQQEAWQPIINAVHEAGGKIIAQLMHAGAQLQYNRFTDKPIAPSDAKPVGDPLGFYGDQEHWYDAEVMTERHFEQVLNGFVAAIKRAEAAGFDGVELHGANGYLLNELLSTHFNTRDDKWGGNLEKRAEFILMLVKAARAAVSDSFVLGIRLSQITVTDQDYQWPEGEAGFDWLVKALREAGIDFIHTTDASVDRKALKDGERSLAEVVRDAGIPLIVNGGIDASNYEDIAKRYPDAVLALGKAALADPAFVNKVKAGEAPAGLDFAMLQPIANVENELKWREAQGK